MFFKIGVIKNFANFAGKHLSLFLIKLWSEDLQLYYKSPTQLFSYEIFEIFKNTFFIEHLHWLLLEFFF